MSDGTLDTFELFNKKGRAKISWLVPTTKEGKESGDLGNKSHTRKG